MASEIKNQKKNKEENKDVIDYTSLETMTSKAWDRFKAAIISPISKYGYLVTDLTDYENNIFIFTTKSENMYFGSCDEALVVVKIKDEDYAKILKDLCRHISKTLEKQLISVRTTLGYLQKNTDFYQHKLFWHKDKDTKKSGLCVMDGKKKLRLTSDIPSLFDSLRLREETINHQNYLSIKEGVIEIDVSQEKLKDVTRQTVDDYRLMIIPGTDVFFTPKFPKVKKLTKKDIEEGIENPPFTKVLKIYRLSPQTCKVCCYMDHVKASFFGGRSNLFLQK